MFALFSSLFFLFVPIFLLSFMVIFLLLFKNLLPLFSLSSWYMLVFFLFTIQTFSPSCMHIYSHVYSILCIVMNFLLHDSSTWTDTLCKFPKYMIFQICCDHFSNKICAFLNPMWPFLHYAVNNLVILGEYCFQIINEDTYSLNIFNMLLKI